MIKFRDKGVLEAINSDFSAINQNQRISYTIPNFNPGINANLTQIPCSNDKNKQEQLESFNGIRTGQLEQVFPFEFLENGRFQFHELIGNEQGKDGITVGINGDI